MWGENIVGRSREFWSRYPSFQERFPEAIGDVDQNASTARSTTSSRPTSASTRTKTTTCTSFCASSWSGDLRGHDRPRRPAGRVEPPLRGAPRDPRCRRTRSASCRTCTGRGGGLRLLPHLLARQHRLGADLGEGPLGAARPAGAVRAGRVRAAAASGCRPACTRSAGSSPRRRRSSGWSAHRGSTRRPTCAT